MNAALEREDVVEVADFAPVDLYKRREKIFTRQITGRFQHIRLYSGWPLLIGYLAAPWLTWDGRQAMLFDLGARQFHVFGITFWPQDFMLLAWLLIIGAFALFAVTSVIGRVWCGYTCPQTVWTAIFMWMEQVAEGPRHARVNLEAAPWSFEKVRKRTFKHGMWLGWAFATGLTFVGYFTPMRELAVSFATFDVPPWYLFWTFGFTAATYVNAGWLREQVCIYMCPYARFQSAMFDADTLIVSYDKTRGEPRGSRKRGAAVQRANRGDCIDCELCVQVCPTGIDIRNGLQYQCIGCAHCIDACDQVMDKMGYARGLVGYATGNSRAGKPRKVFRPRVFGYAGALVAMAALFAWVLMHRIAIDIDVMRDRGELYQRVGERVRNDYSVTLMNRAQSTQEVSLLATSTTGLTFRWLGSKRVTLLPGEIANIAVSLEADAKTLPAGMLDADFVACLPNDQCAHERTRFFGPTP